jgi:hypothetical protein|tara:strand:- start:82 stop:378 length:297 start_codon:yes stop_codon:yes gene_type:complete
MLLVNGCVQNPEILEKRKLDNYYNTTCTTNNDCEWFSTNCCSENSGAYWECMNPEFFDKECIDNNGFTHLPGKGCYTFISKKPENECKCINGFCKALK